MSDTALADGVGGSDGIALADVPSDPDSRVEAPGGPDGAQSPPILGLFRMSPTTKPAASLDEITVLFREAEAANTAAYMICGPGVAAELSSLKRRWALLRNGEWTGVGFSKATPVQLAEFKADLLAAVGRWKGAKPPQPVAVGPNINLQAFLTQLKGKTPVYFTKGQIVIKWPWALNETDDRLLQEHREAIAALLQVEPKYY